MPHSNRATDNARICFLFIEPDAVSMPDECCTLAISPLVRELIQYLGEQIAAYPREGPTARLVTVLLEQLAVAPVKQLHLPISGHPQIRRIADALAADPADRATLAQWADRLSHGRAFVGATGVAGHRAYLWPIVDSFSNLSQ